MAYYYPTKDVDKFEGGVYHETVAEPDFDKFTHDDWVEYTRRESERTSRETERQRANYNQIIFFLIGLLITTAWVAISRH